MSANFTQVSGPGGRVQTLVPGTSNLTFLWNPSSLKGQLDGGDFIYAKRIKLRTTGFITNTNGTGPASLNWEQIQQTLGNVRVLMVDFVAQARRWRGAQSSYRGA